MVISTSVIILFIGGTPFIETDIYPPEHGAASMLNVWTAALIESIATPLDEKLLQTMFSF